MIHDPEQKAPLPGQAGSPRLSADARAARAGGYVCLFLSASFLVFAAYVRFAYPRLVWTVCGALLMAAFQAACSIWSFGRARFLLRNPPGNRPGDDRPAAKCDC